MPEGVGDASASRRHLCGCRVRTDLWQAGGPRSKGGRPVACGSDRLAHARRWSKAMLEGGLLGIRGRHGLPVGMFPAPGPPRGLDSQFAGAGSRRRAPSALGRAPRFRSSWPPLKGIRFLILTLRRGPWAKGHSHPLGFSLGVTDVSAQLASAGASDRSMDPLTCGQAHHVSFRRRQAVSK